MTLAPRGEIAEEAPMQQGGSMKIPKTLSSLTLSFLLLAAAVSVNAQSAGETVIMTISYDVMVGEQLLPKGEYQIKNASPVMPVLQFFSNDRLRVEANALAFRTPVVNSTYAENTALVLEKIGPRYYLREIWVAGRASGLELALPERAKRLKRELEMASDRETERVVVAAVAR
jgi:hypothetical protein